jgi:hypothetical protein
MELGYIFYPLTNPDGLGFSQLAISLYDQPTGKHFDPCEASFPLADQESGVEQTTFYHPTPSARYRVSVGRILIQDFVGKVVEAFSFGGELQIEESESQTLCRLSGSAPIFDLRQPFSPEANLVSAYEIEFARMHAHWQRDDIGFEDRLVGLEPKLLFLGASASVELNLKRLPASSHSEEYWQLRHALRDAVRCVYSDGKLPEGTPILDDLL